VSEAWGGGVPNFLLIRKKRSLGTGLNRRWALGGGGEGEKKGIGVQGQFM